MCPKKFKSKGYLQKHLERHENKRKKRKRRKEGESAKELGEGGSKDVHSNGEGGDIGSDIDSSGDTVDGKSFQNCKKILHRNFYYHLI